MRLEEAARREEKLLAKAIVSELQREPEIVRQVRLLESIPGVGFFSALLFVRVPQSTNRRVEANSAGDLG